MLQQRYMYRWSSKCILKDLALPMSEDWGDHLRNKADSLIDPKCEACLVEEDH